MIPNTLFLLGACALGDPNTTSDDTNSGNADNGPVDTYESTLSDIEAMTAAHGDTVSAATDAYAISDAESDFWSVCQGDWDRMNNCWDAMAKCGMGMGMMGGGDQDAWQSWMNDMWNAMQDHHDTMAHCLDTADCHAREMDWQGQMADMFDHMHGMSTSWPDDCDW